MNPDLARDVRALFDSPYPADRQVAERVKRGILRHMQATRLLRDLDPSDPNRESVEQLCAKTAETVALNAESVRRRVEMTTRRKERAETFRRLRERVQVEGAARVGRDVSYRVARNHGHSHADARRFALNLHPVREDRPLACSAGRHRRASGPASARPRGSRRGSGSGDRAGPDGEPPGEVDPPGLARPGRELCAAIFHLAAGSGAHDTRVSFADLHALTPALRGPDRLVAFDSLPSGVRAAMWASLRADLERRRS